MAIERLALQCQQEYIIAGRRESIVLPVYSVQTQNAKSHDPAMHLDIINTRARAARALQLRPRPQPVLYS